MTAAKTGEDPTDNVAYDNAGNLTNTHLNEAIVYDANNRQTSYTSTGTTTYAYDAQGNRVKKWGPSGTSVYVYDAFGKLAAEYSDVSPQPGKVGTFYRTVDHLGSTRLVTDGLGAAVENTDYLPFGEEITVSPNDTRHGIAAYGESGRVSHKFTGKERDTESDLDYFLARYYSGPMGRFTVPDPSADGVLPVNPQSWNLYAYVRNRPLTMIDVDGRFPKGIHHWIIDRAFPQLSEADRNIVKQGSDYLDRIYDGQAPSQSYTHAQKNGWLRGVPTEESKQSEEFVDRLLREALELQAEWKAAGHVGYNPGTLLRLGMAAHVLQDRESWFHQNLPYWYGGIAPSDWLHGTFEHLYLLDEFGLGVCPSIRESALGGKNKKGR